MPDKKQFVPGVVRAFEEFAEFVKYKWRATILALITLAILGGIFLMLFYGYRQIQLLGTEVNKGVVILEETHSSEAELQEDFIEVIEDNSLVDNIMTKCVFQHDAQAMITFKFHNSRTDLQGRHDFFYSAVNEVSRNGVISFLPDAQAIPIVRLGKYITPMIEGKCQIVHVEAMDDNDWLRGKLALQGIETIVTCPVHSKDGLLIGFTELIYNKDHPMPIDEKLSEVLGEFKQATEHISIIVQK